MEEERCFNNWDLDAVVRLGCRRRLSPPRQGDASTFLPPQPRKEKGKEKAAGQAAQEPAARETEADTGWRFPDLRAAGGDELLRALLAAHPSPLPQSQSQPQPQPQPLPAPPSPPTPPQRQLQPVDVPPPQVHAAPAASAPARAQPSARPVPGGVPRSKRRKNQVKKVVCHVPADTSSSDVWAWRKYGQKPIKGSPYPRGYYRCSSSKGCAARKQVERSRSDPGVFILTYTGEHNHAAPTHRNSLAGTTRHKFPSSSEAPHPPPPSVVVSSPGDEQLLQPQQTSPSRTSTPTAGLSPTTPLRTPSMEEEDDDEEGLRVEDIEMAGEDELMFINTDDDDAVPLESMPSLFDAVDEPFLSSSWVSVSTTAGEPPTGAAGAKS